MSSFADTLTEAQRRKARLHAYASTWLGCISEVMLDSSAIIIIFIVMNGGSNTMTMLSTGISGILSMLLLIPCAGLVDILSPKRTVKYACIVGSIGYLLMAASPFFGSGLAKYITLLGCFLFCVHRPLYTAAWYPLLDNFLRPQDRSGFFGTMRYSYMLLSGGLFFIIGLLMGKTPPMWFMQLIIGMTGILLLGRWFYIDKFPEPKFAKAERYDLIGALKISIKNSSLGIWSLYTCLLAIGYTSILPLTLIYLKQYVQLDASTVQIVSTTAIAGSISAFFCFKYLVRFFKNRFLEVIVHLAFFALALRFFFLSKDTPNLALISAILLFAYNFTAATLMCLNSIEMLSLARPGNKTMATAFCQTYQAIGVAIGRSGSSFIIGAGMLAPTWTKWGREFSSYQTIFLICAIIIAVITLLLPHLPSFIPKHEDYYDPGP